MSDPCRDCGALDHGIYCPSLPKDPPDREVLMRVWAALRGVGMGAPLDMDYAKELARQVNDGFLRLEP